MDNVIFPVLDVLVFSVLDIPIFPILDIFIYPVLVTISQAGPLESNRAWLVASPGWPGLVRFEMFPILYIWDVPRVPALDVSFILILDGRIFLIYVNIGCPPIPNIGCAYIPNIECPHSQYWMSLGSQYWISPYSQYELITSSRYWIITSS